MALMVGNGPFGTEPAGTFNFTVDAPARQLYLEPTPRRLRVVVGGEVVADSTGASVLHETGLMPVYYFPVDDVRADLLEPSDHHTHCPFKGDASYHHVRVGDDVRENAVWYYPEPLEGVPPLAGLVAFHFHAVDAWYEEAERIGVHARDPYHRVDAISSDRHVIVRVGDEVVAESRRPTMVFETGLQPRTYLRAADVRQDLLVASDTVSECPYKGTASRYHSIRVGDQLIEDAIWVYEEPLDEVASIAGLMAFYDEKVTIEHDTDSFADPSPA